MISLPGCQIALDYDLDYTDPWIHERKENVLKNATTEVTQHYSGLNLRAITIRYNEHYKQRMRALLPFPRPSISHGRGCSQCVS